MSPPARFSTVQRSFGRSKMAKANKQKRNRGSTRFDPHSPLGTDAAFVSARRNTMADQFLHEVAQDIARVVAGLAPVTDSVGNVAVPKAELIAELAAYFKGSMTADSFMELAYRSDDQ